MAVKAQVAHEESEHKRRTVNNCVSALDTSCAYWFGSIGWHVLTFPKVMTMGLVLRAQSVLFEKMTESQLSGIALPLGLTNTGSVEIVSAIDSGDSTLAEMMVQLSRVTVTLRRQTVHAELQASETW